MGLSAIVLAAGQGTRMKSGQPKVLHQIAGRTMLSWILDAVAEVGPDRTCVVVGHEAEAVSGVVPEGVVVALQAEQLGTGHAVSVGLAELSPAEDEVILVVPGDTPLLGGERLSALVAEHGRSAAPATLLTARIDDPTGYGRVMRGPQGGVVAVVEHADAGPEELAVDEVATGIYAFAAGPLARALERVGTDNAKGEYYLPDVVAVLAGSRAPLAAVSASAEEVVGVNSYDQLADAAALMRDRINRRWMSEGVWMLDPGRVYIDADASLSAGARIYPGVHIEGSSAVAAGAEVGPEAHVRDSRIGEEARVRYAVLDSAEVGARCNVGPFAYLRPGTVLAAESKAGTFVEMKNTQVGARSKVPHLSYMGDATIGEDANIGAGSITCNWDGVDKHPTTIGDRAFIGSDTMLVAPVEVGDDAYTGAGSTITGDVPPGSLAIERSQQREVPDYAARRKRRAHKRRNDS